MTEGKTKWRLICCEPERNAYKYWFATRVGNVVTRHFGRVGYKGQKKVFTYSSAREAIAATSKKAKSKARGRKDKSTGYRISVYQELALLEASDQQAVIGRMNLEQKALAEISTGQRSTEAQRLIKFLVDSNVHRIVSTTNLTWTGGQLESALGPITPAAVQRGQRALNAISRAIQTGNQYKVDFRRLVGDYLTIVPVRIGMKFEPLQVFPDMETVKAQQEILDSMGALTVTPQDDNDDGRLFEVTLAPEDDDKVISEWVRNWKTTIHRPHPSACLEFARLWRLDIAAMTQAYESSTGSLFELFHGTKPSNLLAIMQTGMQIVPSDASHVTGRAYGDGLYFSDQSTKSLNYSYNGWHGEKRYFMLVSQIAMGNYYVPRSATYGPPPKGYDSIFAQAGRSGVRFNEMIVFSPSRVWPHHLMEFTKKRR